MTKCQFDPGFLRIENIVVCGERKKSEFEDMPFLLPFTTLFTLQDHYVSQLPTEVQIVAELATLIGGFSVKGSKLALKYGKKIIKDMSRRGWTKEKIEDAVKQPVRKVATRDKRHVKGGGRMDDPATAYYHKEGGYVVVNDRTGDVVQVSEKFNSAWKAPWD